MIEDRACTRSQPEGDKYIERSKLRRRLASAVEWLAGEARPPGVKWSRYLGKKPQVEAKGATLRFHETGTFHPLDPAAVSDIIDQVKAWYQVLLNQLMPA